jgi:hypothetical protein
MECLMTMVSGPTWTSLTTSLSTRWRSATRGTAPPRAGVGGLIGDADMDEFSAVVAEYHKAEEQAKGQGRYDEEVDGRDVVTVSSHEGPPGRRGVTSPD